MKSIFLIAFIITLLFCRTFYVSAKPTNCFRNLPEDEFISRVLYLTGAKEIDDISIEVLDNFQRLLQHPLNINTASASMLVSSGLFSEYQAAILFDSRRREGDIMSYVELSYLDGFNKEYVQALMPFVTLKSYTDLTNVYDKYRYEDSVRVLKNDLQLRYSYDVRKQVSQKASRIDSKKGNNFESKMKYNLKYRLDLSPGFEVMASASMNYFTYPTLPEYYNFSLIYHSSPNMKRLLRMEHLAVGDYNLRFGQGLIAWSGFAMSGLYSPRSFDKRGSGISFPWTSTMKGPMRGVATSFCFGRNVINTALSFPKLRPGCSSKSRRLGQSGMSAQLGMSDQLGNEGKYRKKEFFMFPALSYARFYKNGVLSLNYCDDAFSIDCRHNINGVCLFTEVATEVSSVLSELPATVSGVVFPMFDFAKVAVLARYIPSSYNGEHGLYRCPKGKQREEIGFAGAVELFLGRRIPIKGMTGFGSSEQRHKIAASVDYKIVASKKITAQSKCVLNERTKIFLSYAHRFSSIFATNLRVVETISFFNKTDVRFDLKFNSLPWKFNLRNNLSYCMNMGYLGYAEVGYDTDKILFWTRAGYFSIRDWKDRIYAYTRDAPGNFRIPAYKGKDAWLSMYGGMRLLKKVMIYFAGDVYFKSPQILLSLQLNCRF